MLKKYLKKIFSLVMVFVMFGGGFAYKIYAADVDAILLERGYPEMILERMSEQSKLKIIEEDLVFAGAKITLFDDAGEVNSEIDVDLDGSIDTISSNVENDIEPLAGQIPDGDLELTFIFNAKMHTDGYLDYMYVGYVYGWQNTPTFRYQDPIAVTWDPEVFEIKTGSFYKTDQYSGYTYVGEMVYTGTVDGLVHSESNSYANASEAGVSWYADLPGLVTSAEVDGLVQGVVPTKLYGYGEFVLEPKTITYIGSSKLYGHYVHSTTATGLGITINSDGSWSLTGNTSSDYREMGNDKNAEWG